MEKRKKKKVVTKNQMMHLAWLYLKSYGIDMKKNKEILPVINAVFFSLNTLLKNGLTINIQNFGTFEVRECEYNGKVYKTLNGKKYEMKPKRKVVFRYHNNSFE